MLWNGVFRLRTIWTELKDNVWHWHTTPLRKNIATEQEVRGGIAGFCCYFRFRLMKIKVVPGVKKGITACWKVFTHSWFLKTLWCLRWNCCQVFLWPLTWQMAWEAWKTHFSDSLLWADPTAANTDSVGCGNQCTANPSQSLWETRAALFYSQLTWEESKPKSKSHLSFVHETGNWITNMVVLSSVISKKCRKREQR